MPSFLAFAVGPFFTLLRSTIYSAVKLPTGVRAFADGHGQLRYGSAAGQLPSYGYSGTPLVRAWVSRRSGARNEEANFAIKREMARTPKLKVTLANLVDDDILNNLSL